MRNIKLIVCDCDGVLTKGGITYDTAGNEYKTFSVRDGFGINAAHFTGIQVGIITARESVTVHRRAKELGMDEYYHYGVTDKAEAVIKLAEKKGCELEDVAFIGDDIIDMPAMKLVGMPIAVDDAANEVKDIAKIVTKAKGGEGAVREAVETILKSQGTWHIVVEHFGAVRKPL